MKKKDFNLNISFIRAIFCIAVLLYHLNLLKGGYLAVCSFFVLTGYFTCRSLDNSKSLGKYYLNRLKKIYIPLLIVTFTTVSLITILKSNLFNIKPEITSIIFGYNNYYQIGANADYFAKHINSPFMHLWYIGILLQIELIFPIIFTIFKKIGKKIHKIVPCVILFLLFIDGCVYFYHSALNKEIMFTYYDTITRLFSFLLGVFISSVHLNFDKILIPLKRKGLSLFMFFFYIIGLILMFILIDASSKYFAISMILTTIITGRLIEYSIALKLYNLQIKSKLMNLISNISYEIYLVQYPVIFFMDSVKIPSYLKIIIIIIITLIISGLIHFACNFKKNKLKILKVIILIPIILITLYGAFKYIIMEDYTKEMDVLKDKLNENEDLMKKKQEEYLKNQQEEEEKWQEYLNSLEVNEEELKEYVTNLKIVGIGDSILLDAIDTLYKQFPNGYFDGKISRTTCAGADVLADIKNKGITWDVLVFSLGTNGYPSDKCKDRLMELAGDSKVFWLNATRPDYDTNNAELERYAKGHDNIYILDWESVIKEHSEYLYNDYIHLRPQGFKPYAEFIRDGIFDVYLKEYNAEKDKKISEAEESKKNKISFYGNELLINVFDMLESEFETAKFEAKEGLDYNALIKILEEEKENNTLNQKLVFAFDKQNNLTKEEYKKIIKLCEDRDIYIITLDDIDIIEDNVKIIKINLDKEDIMSDKIHITKSGNKKIVEKIVTELKG